TGFIEQGFVALLTLFDGLAGINRLGNITQQPDHTGAAAAFVPGVADLLQNALLRSVAQAELSLAGIKLFVGLATQPPVPQRGRASADFAPAESQALFTSPRP